MVRQVVFLKSTTKISGIAGKVVRLCITLKNADLVSFQFAAEPVTK